MVLGMVLGLLVRVLVTLLGGRVEGVIVSLLAMNLSGDLAWGFFSVYIGTRALSVLSEVLNPISEGTSLDPERDLVESFLEKGLGMVLVRQGMILETFLGGLIILLGAVLGTRDNTWFNELSITYSPWILGLISLLVLIRAEKKGLYLLGVILVGTYGVLITKSGVGGQFSVLVALSLLYGFSWTKGTLVEQVWAPELGSGNWRYDPWAFLVGVLSACFIGTPVALIMKTLDQSPKAIDRYTNGLVASVLNNNTSLLLWFLYGSARSSYADSLAKNGLVLEGTQVWGFVLIILVFSVLVLTRVDKLGPLYYALVRLFNPRLLGLISYSVLVLGLLGLGLEFNSLLVLLGISLLMNVVVEKLRMPREALATMTMTIPLFSIWLFP